AVSAPNQFARSIRIDQYLGRLEDRLDMRIRNRSVMRDRIEELQQRRTGPRQRIQMACGDGQASAALHMRLGDELVPFLDKVCRVLRCHIGAGVRGALRLAGLVSQHPTLSARVSFWMLDSV